MIPIATGGAKHTTCVLFKGLPVVYNVVTGSENVLVKRQAYACPPSKKLPDTVT